MFISWHSGNRIRTNTMAVRNEGPGKDSKAMPHSPPRYNQKRAPPVPRDAKLIQIDISF